MSAFPFVMKANTTLDERKISCKSSVRCKGGPHKRHQVDQATSFRYMTIFFIAFGALIVVMQTILWIWFYILPELCQRMGQIRKCWEAVALSPLMPRRKIDESDEAVSDLPFISTYARNGGYSSKGGGKQLPELSW